MSKLPRLNVVLEGHKPILERLSTKERKAAEHAAFSAGAIVWFVAYAPLRFARYAFAKLGYFLKSSHIQRKKNYGVEEPLVWTGETREAVLSKPTLQVGGSAGQTWVDIKFRLPGPRAPIVYEVLNQILDGELGGAAQEIARVLTELLGQAQSVGGKSQRLTLTGATSSLASRHTMAARALGEKRQGQADDAEDRRVLIAEGRGEAKARVARRLKRTHDRWRRTSGGSAGDGSQLAASYLRSSRYRNAQRQARFRAAH